MLIATSWFTAIDGNPAVARARAVGKDYEFNKVNDEETKRALAATAG
jgi:GST-like protein